MLFRSYLAALVVLARVFPNRTSAAARLATAVRVAGLLAVLLAAGWLCDWKLDHALSLVLRLLLIPAGLLGVFALGLIQRQDLAKLAAIELRWGPFRRLRDSLVLLRELSGGVLHIITT